MFTLPNYQIVELLHQGKFRNIFRGVSLVNNQPVIIKIHVDEIPSAQQHKALIREFEIAKTFEHPHLLKYLALEKTEHHLALVIEDFGGVQLEKLIPKNGFQPMDFLKIALQLVAAVKVIHQQHMIHQAINPYSIFVDPKNYFVKLGDFKAVSQLLCETQAPFAVDHFNINKLAYISPEQTGRMNRLINQSADFYSLGIVFYQMLYGCLPFANNDALQLVYSHLALQPTFPQKKTEIPLVFFKIIKKLLAKNSEDRYQSAYGLEADLQEAFNQLTSTGTIQDFEIAQQDAIDRFCIPQKLYGREVEIKKMLETFHEVSEGKTDKATLLVHGYSGVGKTSLINEIQKSLVQARGNFITGKCDQLERHVPYAAFIQAFKTLIQQILMEDEEKIAEWKTKLLAAMGLNSQIMIDVIPELENILGAQPAVSKLTPLEHQYRFQKIFCNFLSVFSQPDHPLVLFIDDIQWSSIAGINLAKFILLNADTRYLYFIAAYRDNEVDDNHPLTKMLDEVQKQKTIQDIALNPLDFPHVNQLIADTMHTTASKTKQLALAVYNKTQGNPFFTNQLLTTLFQNKLVKFDPSKKCWTWDLKKIQKSNITDNVVDLMITKICQLPKATQTVLSLAAHIGYEFSIDILSIIYEDTVENTTQMLWSAIQEGLILSSGKNYSATSEYSQFHFLHDRVQQAAVLLVPDEKRKALQLNVGRLLLEKTPSAELEKKLFYIVGQLNAGRELITDVKEKIRLAELNLSLAKKSKDSTAYTFAANHAQIGIDLLPQLSWLSHYELTLALYKQLVESNYLIGNFDVAEKLYPFILDAAKTVFDKISIYYIQTNQLELQGRYAEAVQIMRASLALFNVVFPDDEVQLQSMLEDELKKIKDNLSGKELKQLLDAPEITDPQIIAIINLLQALWTPCFVRGLQTLLMVANAKMTNLSLEHGNCEYTSVAYAGYSYYAGALTGDYIKAYELGKIGIKLSHQYNDLSLRCKSYFLFANGTCVWIKPLSKSCQYLERSYELGIESGNLTYASYASHFIIFYHFLQGNDFAVVSELLKNYLGFLRRINPTMFDYAMALTQSIRDLLGITENFDEVRYLATYPQKSVFGSAYYLSKIINAYLLDHISNDLTHVDKALEIIPIFLQGTFKAVAAEFYVALTYLAAYTMVDAAMQQQYLQKVETIHSHMQIWMNNYEANFSSQYFLIAAEKARVLGKSCDEIMALYEQAIATARQHKFIQYEALGNELYAKYWLSKNKEKIANIYLQDAYRLYERWGATAKLQQLKHTYPHLLMNIVTPDLASGVLQPFDLKTSIKAAQAISSEINLDKLLAMMMQVIMENAGAQKGTFFLNNMGNFTVEAECNIQTGDIRTLQAIPLESWDNGSLSIVQYVKRTKQLIILGAANKDLQFASDVYIFKTQTPSILCMPIMKQKEIQGVLYLENNLAAHAFTTNHVEILKILTSQIAISLENAHLYKDLRSITERLDLALKAANIGTWNWHVPTNQVTWDQRMYEIYGVHKEKFLHTRNGFMSLVHPDDRATLANAIERTIKDGAPFYVEHRIIKPSDQTVHVLVGQADIYHDAKGQPIRLIGVNWDITQRKHLEEERVAALQQAEEKECQRAQEAEKHKNKMQEFVDTVCHEIRNSLNGICGSLSLLLDNFNSLKQLLQQEKSQPNFNTVEKMVVVLRDIKEELNILNICANQEKLLINDVLEYSKLESNKITLHAVVFDLRNVLTVIIKMFDAQVQQKELKLLVNLPDIPLFLKADEYRLTQILQNLISNAVKFTHQGSITIYAQAEPISDTQTKLCMTVEDTGIGMTKNEQTLLFQRFSQASDYTAAEYGGSGLGLVICKQLVELMGGTITVESEKGRGTKFNFTIRCQNVLEEEYAITQVKPKKSTLTSSSEIVSQYTILVVDDNAINQKVLSSVLKKKGCICKFASHGLDALKKFSEQKYDMIFMDIEMPIMGGLEATQKIRQQESKQNFQATPIIGLSGNARLEQTSAAIKAGMNAYITKPFSKEEIDSILNEYLNVEIAQKATSSQEIPLAAPLPKLFSPKSPAKGKFDALEEEEESSEETHYEMDPTPKCQIF